MNTIIFKLRFGCNLHIQCCDKDFNICIVNIITNS